MRVSRERRQRILLALAAGETDVEVLAQRFSVSPSTVRRDLQRLSEDKAVMRTYGGAILAPPAIEETFAQREALNIDAKHAIAEAALTFVKENDTIILDGGSTVATLAQKLRGHRLQVITNSMKAAFILADDPGITLTLLGGAIRPISMTSYGPLAEDAMRSFTAASLFTSADGVVAERGLCEATLEQAALKRLMMRQAAKVFVLADASKLGTATQSAWAQCPNQWHLITDAAASPESLAPFRATGATIIKAKNA